MRRVTWRSPWRRRGEREEWLSGVAVAYGFANDREKTLEYLDKSYAQADEELLLSIRMPAFDFIRSDARYQDFMRRIGLPE